MKVKVRGIRSLVNETNGVRIDGITLLTGANSSGKSSYLLGLRLLQKFLKKCNIKRTADLFDDFVSIKDIGAVWNFSDVGKGDRICFDIDLENDLEHSIQLVFSAKDNFEYFLQEFTFSIDGKVVICKTKDDTSSAQKPDFMPGNLDYDVSRALVVAATEAGKVVSDESFLSHYSYENARVSSLDILMHDGILKESFTEGYHVQFQSKPAVLPISRLIFHKLLTSPYGAGLIESICKYNVHDSNEEDVKKNDIGNRVYKKSENTSTIGNFWSRYGREDEMLRMVIENYFEELTRDDKGMLDYLMQNEDFQLNESIIIHAGEEHVIRQGKLGDSSPFMRYLLFLNDIFDQICILHLRQLEQLDFFEKLEIKQKLYFTNDDRMIFGSLLDVCSLNEHPMGRYFFGELYCNLIGFGKSVKVANPLVGNICTINLVMEDESVINVGTIGTGHFHLVCLYLKLTALLSEYSDFFSNSDEKFDFILSRISINRTIILVEPESFLHPSVQVRLAQMLVVFANFGIHFIIETHSEHFIRALQLQVAKKRISHRKVNIYFFDNVGGTSIRKIRIDKRGFLLDKFGEGFLDETPRLIEEFFKTNSN